MWMGLIYRLTFLAIIVTLVIALWPVRQMLVPQSYDEAQIKCFAAILRADTIGEEASLRPLVQEKLADAVNRARVNSGGTQTYCSILQSAAMIYPPGWKHTVFFTGRDADTIKMSPRYVGSPWIDAEERAKKFAGAAPSDASCAQYIVRAVQRYALFTGEKKAAEEIAVKMKPDPTQDQRFTTKFFCP